MDQWKTQLVTLLQRNKRFPEDMQCVSGNVQLAFRLDREGQIVSSRIQTSSGTPAFDAEALDMLVRIKRFPPPPQPDTEFFNFTVPIRFEALNDGCPRN